MFDGDQGQAIEAFFNSPWPYLFGFGWLALVAVLSVARRRQLGEPIFPQAPASAIFVEKRASGRNLSTLRGRIGGASNCLLVSVTDRELRVTPTFPFNLFFLPEVYGLDFRISRASPIRLENKKGLLGETIIVRAGDCHFELQLRDADKFRLALGTI